MKKKPLLNRKKPDWFWPVLAIILIIVIVAIVLIVKNQTEDNAILGEDNLLSDNSDDSTSRTLVGKVGSRGRKLSANAGSGTKTKDPPPKDPPLEQTCNCGNSCSVKTTGDCGSACESFCEIKKS